MSTDTESKTYNGWTNYETWNAKLWIDNERSSYEYWRDQSRSIFRRAVADQYNTQSERASHTLADQLKSEHEDAIPECSGMYADILSAAMSEINWDEIARSMIEDLEND